MLHGAMSSYGLRKAALVGSRPHPRGSFLAHWYLPISRDHAISRDREWFTDVQGVTILMVTTVPHHTFEFTMSTSRARRRSSPVLRHRIPAGQFKATCLAVMDEVQRTGTAVTVTRYGTPLVRVIPAVDPAALPLFGRLKGTVRISGDIVAPIDVEWSALADD